MISFISSTPEELFQARIEDGNFEQALRLAKLYEMDADPVYQSKWLHLIATEGCTDESLRILACVQDKQVRCHAR